MSAHRRASGSSFAIRATVLDSNTAAPVENVAGHKIMRPICCRKSRQLTAAVAAATVRNAQLTSRHKIHLSVVAAVEVPVLIDLTKPPCRRKNRSSIAAVVAADCNAAEVAAAVAAAVIGRTASVALARSPRTYWRTSHLTTADCTVAVGRVAVAGEKANTNSAVGYRNSAAAEPHTMKVPWVAAYYSGRKQGPGAAGFRTCVGDVQQSHPSLAATAALEFAASAVAEELIASFPGDRRRRLLSCGLGLRRVRAMEPWKRTAAAAECLARSFAVDAHF